MDDSITRVEEPFADPWIAANAWHVRGSERDLIIDTGLGIASLRDLLVSRFGREPIAVVTHAHLDHLGSAHEFAECWAHELEPTEASEQGTLFGERLLQILGAEDVEIERPADIMLSALPRPDYDIAAYRLNPVVPTRRIHDGDVIDLGDRALVVLHLPGHTPGSIGLLDPANRVLFTGDVIYDPPVLLDSLHGSSVPDYITSMRRLLTLDVDRVYAGHGDVFDGARLHELVNEYLQSVAD